MKTANSCDNAECQFAHKCFILSEGYNAGCASGRSFAVFAFGDPHRRLTVLKPFSLHYEDRAEQVLAGKTRLSCPPQRRLAELFEIAVSHV